jgi:hypothetical protein
MFVAGKTMHLIYLYCHFQSRENKAINISITEAVTEYITPTREHNLHTKNTLDSK